MHVDHTLVAPLISNELTVLSELVPLSGQEVIELGCGSARLARTLLEQHPGMHITGLETDRQQHAKNVAAPHMGLDFLLAGAQDIPFPESSFDLALMLKSLHHVPIPLMAQAIGEVGRVLRPGGYFYISEPVYAGPLNEIIRLFNDEGIVRRAAQDAVDEALRSKKWIQVEERWFEMPVQFKDCADFERRMMHSTFASHRTDDEMVSTVRERFAPHCGADGAYFTRPMHVRLLQKQSNSD
jgi:SAM-dependent methyltransferase